MSERQGTSAPPSDLTTDDEQASPTPRILLALDEYESGQWALDFTIGTARRLGTAVWVLHLRERARSARLVSLETPTEARDLVGDAVTTLREAGVDASGRVLVAPRELYARAIAAEARTRDCEGIVLGSRRLHGFNRVASHRVRDQVARVTQLPLLVAPAPVTNGIRSPATLRPDPADPTGVGRSGPLHRRRAH